MALRGLLLFLVFLIVLWRWRQWRDGKRGIKQRDAQPLVEIVVCHACGVHLPRGDALKGARGHFYCCVAHQNQSQNKK